MGWKPDHSFCPRYAGPLVEREPMWDGNQLEEVWRLWQSRLSENQCGMETLGLILLVFSRCYVEREPMWDGNR